jgi:hypothetical protein
VSEALRGGGAGTAVRLWALAALVVVACDSRPIGPSTVPPAAAAPAPLPRPPVATLTINLTGTVVDADGRPVADAAVKMSPFIPGAQSEPLSTTTGPTGRYEFTFENAAGQQSGGFAVASKPGHEDDYRYIMPAANQVQNFRLYPITRLAAGDTIQVTVLPDEGTCGLSDEWTCRKFRVVSPTSGTLTITATPETGDGAGYLEIPRPYQCCRSPLSVPVTANEEVRVHVLMDWTSKVAQTFRLSVRDTTP